MLPAAVHLVGADSSLVDAFYNAWTGALDQQVGDSASSKRSTLFRPNGKCQVLPPSTLSLLGDSHSLVEVLLQPGVLVYCSGDVPQRTSLLRRLNQAAALADVVAPLPRSARNTVRFPVHFVVLIDDRQGTIGPFDESSVVDWLIRTESTYDQSGMVDEDSVRRNEMKIIVSGLFKTFKILRVASDVHAVERAATSVSNLLGSCSGVEPGLVAKISKRLSQLKRDSWQDAAERAQSQWAAATARAVLQEDFIGYCEHRVHRMTSDTIRSLHDSVVERCHRILDGGHCLPKHLAAINVEASSALDSLLLQLVRIEEERAEAARRPRATQPVTLPQVPLVGFLARYVPAQYHFWFTRTGLTFIGVMVLFVLGGFVFRPR